jgi:hypothetical protein
MARKERGKRRARFPFADCEYGLARMSMVQ